MHMFKVGKPHYRYDDGFMFKIKILQLSFNV